MNGKFVTVLAVLGYSAALFRCALEALRANSTPVFPHDAMLARY